jgi:hypothetical protein
MLGDLGTVDGSSGSSGSSTSIVAIIIRHEVLVEQLRWAHALEEGVAEGHGTLAQEVGSGGEIDLIT